MWSNIYTYDAVNTTAKTITLTSKWTHGTIPAGTYVSQSSAGNWRNYSLICGNYLSTSWTYYNYILTGTLYKNAGITNFRPGTKYIKFMILNNYDSKSNVTTYLKNLIFSQID